MNVQKRIVEPAPAREWRWKDIPVLFQDDDIFAVDKPAGLLCVRDRWDAARPNVMDLFAGAGLGFLSNVHRLDFGTSGVFLMARNGGALSALVRQFRERTAEKSYVALVVGELPQGLTRITEPIAPDPRKPGLSKTLRSGRPAETEVETAERFRGYSLIRARPLTGRMHQIRLHLKHVGCPVVADVDYGNGEPLLLSRLKRGFKSSGPVERPLIARQALHAAELIVTHPSKGGQVAISAPLPKDMDVALKQLRKYARA